MRNQRSDYTMQARSRSTVDRKAMRPRNSNFKLSTARRSWGAIMPILVVSLAGMIGMAGLALDMGHVYFKKSEYQNAADAAALSAYKRYETSSGTPAEKAALASNEAVTVFQAHLSGVTPVVRFSTSLAEADAACSNFPYLAGSVPSSATTMFVCVGAELNLPVWLTRALPSGASNVRVPGSAVAGRTGPPPVACSNIPLVWCGANDPPIGEARDWYSSFKLLYSPSNTDEAMGVSDSSGVNCRAIGSSSQVYPGASIGNMSKGLDVRFGYIHPSLPPNRTTVKYPPDVITTVIGSAPYYRYSNYKSAIIAGGNWSSFAPARPGRRILRISVGSDCSSGTTVLKDVVCYYMIIRPQTGSVQLYGEFIPAGDCPEQANTDDWYDPGSSGSTTNTRIVLFK